MLELVDHEVRHPGAGEVLVRVAAAGLNRADCLQRRGRYPAPPGAPPDVPGLEYAGTVAEVGDGVRWPRVGDRVMGVTGGGGMATHLIAHGREVVGVPEGLSLTDAAAFPEAFFTAYDAMFVQGGLGLGQVVLVHAAGSGVGTAAIQLALAAGATPIGTSRTADKLDRCRALGLEHAVHVQGGRFSAEVRRVAPGGAHLILDFVGAAYLPENLAAVASRGRVVVIGLLGGITGELPLGVLLAKRARIVGTVLRSRPLEEKASLARAVERDVVPLLASGRVRPVVEEVLPMERVAEAHARMERDETFGKLVLAWE